MIAYYHPDVAPGNAKESGAFAAIQCAGSWSYTGHNGGTLAIRPGFSAVRDSYGAEREATGGLTYWGPLVVPGIYDLARPDSVAGVDVRLSCGLVISVPHALVQHRQLRLGGSGGMGAPVTEYGRIAGKLHEHARVSGGIAMDSPELARLLTLAVAQCYEVTADLLDDLGILCAEDVDAILGAAWCGDPKALAIVSDSATSA